MQETYDEHGQEEKYEVRVSNFKEVGNSYDEKVGNNYDEKVGSRYDDMRIDLATGRFGP